MEIWTVGYLIYEMRIIFHITALFYIIILKARYIDLAFILLLVLDDPLFLVTSSYMYDVLYAVIVILNI